MPDHYDVIIVGAGSAGCPLAARLSETVDRKILLLDAGPHYRSLAEYPRELVYASSLEAGTPGHPNNWNFVGNVTERIVAPIPRGRVVGGSSAINGAAFVRGTPQDFDGWARLGHDLWSYEQVLPYFRKLETDANIADPCHGADGPIRVRRGDRSGWMDDEQAFVDACLALGCPVDSDMNGAESIGVGALPMNNVDGVRLNTAHAYLEPILGRPNLKIQGNTEVQRIILSGRRATGVVARYNGREVHYLADEIVLAAGAIKSPHLLLLSGIGPAEELRSAGIEVVLDLPGVGKGFSDHPGVLAQYVSTGRIPKDELLPTAQTCLHMTAEGSSIIGDIEIMPIPGFFSAMAGAGSGVLSPLLRHPLRSLKALKGVSVARLLMSRRPGARTILCSLQQPAARGEIRITSPDPSQNPQIDYHYFEDGEDLRRMREALRFVGRALETPAFKALGARMSSPDAATLASNASLDSWIGNNAFTAIHMAGSCKMGARDAGGVVDQHLRVHGIDGLRVVDASIQPLVVRRPGNATAVMIGERAAGLWDDRG